MGSRTSTFAVEAATPTPTRVWSDQQGAIFEWFLNGTSNLVVRARAGTGKTTTIIEGVGFAPEASILLCAFNKKIAEELNSRITNPRAEAKTLHSVGYAAIRRTWRGMPVSTGPVRADDLTMRACARGDKPPFQILHLISQLHTKARDMVPLRPSLDELTDMAWFFDLVPDEGWGKYDVGFVVGRALRAMEIAATEEPTYDIGIDFADMIYLPLAWNLLSKDYEMVVVDEAQDLTVAQLTIAQRICQGRICVVGDDRQAIYAFRGADTGSLDRLKRELQAEELPLTLTYRCAQSVTRRAQGLVPDIIAADTNPEGEVVGMDYQKCLESVQPGAFILSRLNAPLVSLTLQLLSRQKRARMAGRDVGAGIQAVLKKIQCYGGTTIEVVLTRLDEWKRKQSTRLAASGQLALVDRVHDQAEMIRALSEGASTAGDIVRQCEWLFVDTGNPADFIICSSVHKAKGLEAEWVYLLQESLYRRGVDIEEQNIEYVATTRAKTHLVLVTGVPGLQRR